MTHKIYGFSRQMALRQEYEYQSMTLNCSLGNHSLEFLGGNVTNRMQNQVFEEKHDAMEIREDKLEGN